MLLDEEALDDEGLLNEDEPCEKCGGFATEGTMLECDRCLRGYHLKCLRLPDIPEGSWLCPCCVKGKPPGPREVPITARERFLHRSRQLGMVRIETIWQEFNPFDGERDGEYFLVGRWYFRPEDTHVGRRGHHVAREVFLSTSIDTLWAKSLLRPVVVCFDKEFEDRQHDGDDVFLCKWVPPLWADTYLDEAGPLSCSWLARCYTPCPAPSPALCHALMPRGIPEPADVSPRPHLPRLSLSGGSLTPTHSRWMNGCSYEYDEVWRRFRRSRAFDDFDFEGRGADSASEDDDWGDRSFHPRLEAAGGSGRKRHRGTAPRRGSRAKRAKRAHKRAEEQEDVELEELSEASRAAGTTAAVDC